jgi:hypothetical protein
LRNNRPLLAYIGGKSGRFTSKDHIFRPGESFEKQIIVINNSRETASGSCDWTLGIPQMPVSGSNMFSVATGQQERIPLSFALPATVPSGTYRLSLTTRFEGGEIQDDSFDIQVLERHLPEPSCRIALFDPRGETRKLLTAMKIRFRDVDASADLSSDDLLIVGKSTLTLDGPAPRLDRVRDGLKVLVFEQTSAVLERRLGFRVAEYGFRQVFPRVADHPALANLGLEHLRDWRGQSTLVPPRLDYELRPRHGPTVTWCGIPVSHIWRCGTQGTVASVVIEKPPRGDFLPILDCGFGLQYSPLMQYREGRGGILFCQLDVTGRSEPEPAAENLVRSMIVELATWKPAPSRKVCYAGDGAGLRHLESAGFAVSSYGGSRPSKDCVLVVGPAAHEQIKSKASGLAGWLEGGGKILAIGLDESETRNLFPIAVRMERKEHIAAYLDRFDARSPLVGIGPADMHDRDARQRPLLSGGVILVGDGLLGHSAAGSIVFCQVVPWEYDAGGTPNVKRTFRRASFLVSRLLANTGAASSTPLLARFATPASATEERWKAGLYLDQPEEWDDPYRFFRW